MPWLTSNVFKQGPGEPLMHLPESGKGKRAIRFRHIIHAYRDHQLPQNTAVQEITFESVRDAARYAGSDYDVSCVAVVFDEDSDLIPSGVVKAAPLTRVAGDVAQFQVPRPLPLLFDVLNLGVAAELPRPDSRGPAKGVLHRLGFGRQTHDSGGDQPAEEYIVLTNSDIHLQPTFYKVIGAMIDRGFDVITVNRRTVHADLGSRTFSPLFLADHGENHPGFDCFVFPRSMMDGFAQSLSCCGAGHVMRSLIFNLVANAERFAMLTEAHLTYHLGDDRVWNADKFSDYIDFNIAQARSVIASLVSEPIKGKRLTEFLEHEGPTYAPPWNA